MLFEIKKKLEFIAKISFFYISIFFCLSVIFMLKIIKIGGFMGEKSTVQRKMLKKCQIGNIKKKKTNMN